MTTLSINSPGYSKPKEIVTQYELEPNNQNDRKPKNQFEQKLNNQYVVKIKSEYELKQNNQYTASKSTNQYQSIPHNQYRSNPSKQTESTLRNQYTAKIKNEYDTKLINQYSPKPNNEYSPKPNNEYSPKPNNQYSPKPKQFDSTPDNQYEPNSNTTYQLSVSAETAVFLNHLKECLNTMQLQIHPKAEVQRTFGTPMLFPAQMQRNVALKSIYQNMQNTNKEKIPNTPTTKPVNWTLIHPMLSATTLPPQLSQRQNKTKPDKKTYVHPGKVMYQGRNIINLGENLRNWSFQTAVKSQNFRTERPMGDSMKKCSACGFLTVRW